MLEKLAEEHIFLIYTGKNKSFMDELKPTKETPFIIEECCDNYYALEMSIEDMNQLIKELQDLVKEEENEKNNSKR